MHGLLHFVHYVRMWGPLWTHSMFGFENMNGYLKKQFHSTKSILPQLAFMIQARDLLAASASTSSHRIHNTHLRGQPIITINETTHTYAIGKVVSMTLENDFMQALLNSGIQITDEQKDTHSFNCFAYLMHMGILYQAGQYRKALSRKNSTICQYYTSIDGSIHIGSIQLIGMATEPFVIIKQYNFHAEY